MPNRLANETSPYLLQHAHNPVDWWPWSAEALARAVSEDKPILLSIGYAACHWCHVMERESFEDEGTAALMNERFINIKVDREERPDIDSIYMQAVQAMTGHGGWPMTMFLTPDGTPFYGGTYFPKEDRHGMPSFRRILLSVSEAYGNNKEAVVRTTDSVREMYASSRLQSPAGGGLTRDTFIRAAGSLISTYDAARGGFGGAPKFPPSMTLEFLLAQSSRTDSDRVLTMVRETFFAMARGGIYDQIGGGLSRYSVDADWLVPHFEKMLYDNALFIRLGTHLWQATQNAEIRRTVDDTIEWVRREMTSPDGGFYASLDADSEGSEGKYYVWTSDDFDAAAAEAGGTSDEVAALRRYWNIADGGHFDGANILHVTVPVPEIADARLRELRGTLYALRERRMRPARDDKILASWNGLMIRGIAEAARAFGDPTHRALAQRAAEFIFANRVECDRVTRTMRGQSRVAGFLEDHAAVGLAALSLYELTFDKTWLDRARSLCASMTAVFWDERTNAFFDTPHDHERLIVRPHDVTDNAMPSGNSLAVDLLARVGIVTDDDALTTRARTIADSLSEPMARHPLAFGHLLCAADMLVRGSVEVAIAGDPSGPDHAALALTAASVYVPSLVVAGGESTGVALLQNRPTVGGRATAYVCRSFSCDAPVTDPEQLRNQLVAAGQL
jgi:uncharacterized protein YyaL (SSP411 family)